MGIIAGLPRQLRIVWNHPSNRGFRFKYTARFVRWSFHKRLSHRPIDIQFVDHLRLRCHHDSSVASAVMYFRLPEYTDALFVLRLLRPGDHFLDIGANVGFYTLLAASRVGDGQITAFEPSPKYLGYLKENIELNQLQNVRLVESAVADTEGSIEFEIRADDATSAIATEVARPGLVRTVRVPVTTLDALLGNSPSLDKMMMAKVDIEGAEMRMLQGAKSLLRRHRPAVWAVEIDDKCRRFGFTEEQVIEHIRGFGYQLHTYDPLRNQIVAIASLKQSLGSNVLFIADDRIEEVSNRLATSKDPLE